MYSCSNKNIVFLGGFHFLFSFAKNTRKSGGRSEGGDPGGTWILRPFGWWETYGTHAEQDLSVFLVALGREVVDAHTNQ